MKNRIEVLWTGGWDSTFMLCLLAKTKNVDIQPYYIDIERQIRKEEKKAIQTIYKILKKKKDLKGNILPCKFVPVKYTKPDEDVLNSFFKFRGKPYEIGGQYKYIAQFAKTHPGICWGQERYLETPGHMTRLLQDKGSWKFDSDGVGYFIKEDCDPDVFNLFGNLRCPIAKYSEPMMWEKIKEWGYEDVFQNIRFCYYPIDGKPCGMCYYCETKRKQKMDFLFSKEALILGDAIQEIKSQAKSLAVGNNDPFNKPLDYYFMFYKNPTFREDCLKNIVGDDESDDFVQIIKEKEFDSKVSLYRNYFDKAIKKAKEKAGSE